MSADISKIQILIARGRFKEAEAMLRDALAREPDDADLHIGLSHTLRMLERPKEAEEAARRAIGLDADSGYPHEVLAHALIDSSKWSEAEAAIEQANVLDGEDADRRGLLAKISMERGKNAESLAHAEAGLAIDPDHDLCRLFRGMALGKLGRHEEADETAKDLLSDDPDDSYNHSARGWILMERGAAGEAKMHFQEALRIDPENEDARLGLARSLQQQHPLLGWLLRLVVRVGKIPFGTQVVVAMIVAVVAPRFLLGSDKPLFLIWLGQIVRIAFALFFFIVVAARPIFDSLLALSRDGRLALSHREMQAVRWCILPMLAGLAYMGFWVATGGKSVPYQGLSLIATAALLHEGFTTRHPWVKRRMLGISALAGLVSLWATFAAPVVLKPVAERLLAKISTFPETVRNSKDRAKLPADIAADLEHMLRVRNWAFIYPALLLYLAAAFSDEISTALLRRAPDESE